MKIVVIGGTGLIGSKLVERLDEAGHDAVPASPETGVDTYTGKGLEQENNVRVAPTDFDGWLSWSVAG